MKNQKANALAKSDQRTKLVQALAILIALVVASGLVAFLLGVTWQTILIITILSAVLAGLGVLNALNERFRKGQWIEKGLAAYLYFCSWMLLAFLPASGLLGLNRLVLLKLTLGFQVVVFFAWGAVLAWAIWLVSTERKRDRFFNWLQRGIGRFAPLAYSFNLLMIALIFFSSVTYVASAYGKLHLIGLTQSNASFDTIQDFYLWHFLEAVPVLKVTETLRWKAPVSYDSRFVGLILLLFKLAVILPVIACFVHYWKGFGLATKREVKPTAREVATAPH